MVSGRSWPQDARNAVVSIARWIRFWAVSLATTTAPPPPVVHGQSPLSTGIGCTCAAAMWRPVAFWTQPASSRETAVTIVARPNTGRASRRASRDVRRSAASVPWTVRIIGAPFGTAMPAGTHQWAWIRSAPAASSSLAARRSARHRPASARHPPGARSAAVMVPR